MGVCTRHLWDMGTPCKVNPPNNVWFVQAKAGDRMKVGRRYAEDEKKINKIDLYKIYIIRNTGGIGNFHPPVSILKI